MTADDPPNALREPGAIVGDRAQALNDAVDRGGLRVRIAAHLFVRLQRLERLRLEARRAHVPEHRRARRIVAAARVDAVECRVQHGLAVALDERARAGLVESPPGAEPEPVRANREVQILGVSEVRMVTAGARDVFRAGENRIPEKEPPELDSFRRRRIVRRRAHLARKRGELRLGVSRSREPDEGCDEDNRGDGAEPASMASDR